MGVRIPPFAPNQKYCRIVYNKGMSNIRRINFFGGPGAGKSTTATYVFSHAKIEGKNIEFVDEVVKLWAFEKRHPTSFDQLYLTAKQLRKEDVILRNNVQTIITDSPVMLSACYAKQQGFVSWQSLLQIAMDFEATYPSLNIYLNRQDKPYFQSGRFQNYDEALEMDKLVRSFLEKSGLEYHEFPYSDRTRILSFVLERI